MTKEQIQAALDEMSDRGVTKLMYGYNDHMFDIVELCKLALNSPSLEPEELPISTLEDLNKEFIHVLSGGSSPSALYEVAQYMGWVLENVVDQGFGTLSFRVRKYDSETLETITISQLHLSQVR